MAKRANGEGTVARPANGTWEAKLTYADPATGQRRRVSFYGPTARRPGVKRGEARHLDGDAVTAVLRASEVSRYHPVLVLIASTGLRKGEALALRWDKVDLEAGVLRVAATIARVDGRLVISEPKTDRSRRSRAAVRRRDAAQAQSPPRPPNGCAPRTNGPTRAWCSPPSWAGPSTRATCCT